MIKLGICSALIARKYKGKVEDLNYETCQLYEVGQKYYDEVILIDPQKVTFQFLRGMNFPEIYYNNNDISDLSSLIVRGTGGCEQSIKMLVNALTVYGCDILDPLERFSDTFSSKLLTTLERHQRGVGTSSYFAFSYENAVELLNTLDSKKKFPLITKPIEGKKGKGVKKLCDAAEAIEHAKDFFEENKDMDELLFLQDFIEFKAEYRVMLVNGNCCGIVKKYSEPNAIAKNVSQGGEFVPVEAPGIADFAIKNASSEGILGIDIGEDNDDHLHIIESNRAPLWKSFEEATGIHVAEEIIKNAFERIREKDKTITTPLV